MKTQVNIRLDKKLWTTANKRRLDLEMKNFSEYITKVIEAELSVKFLDKKAEEEKL